MRSLGFLVSAAAILATGQAFAADLATTGEVDAEFNIFSSEDKPNTGTTTKTENNGFVINRARLNTVFTLNDTVSARFRFRLNSTSYDYAYVDTKLHDMIKLRIGKQWSDAGSLSSDYSLADLYAGAATPSPGFVTGASVHITPVENQTVALYMVNTSADGANPDVLQKTPTLGVVYNGDFGGIMPKVSFYMDSLEKEDADLTATPATPELKAVSNQYVGVGVRAVMAGFDGSIDYNMATLKARVTGADDQKYTAIAGHLQYTMMGITPVAEFGIGNKTIGDAKTDYTDAGFRVEYTQDDWAGLKYYAGFRQKKAKVKDGNEVTDTTIMAGLSFRPSIKLSTPPPAPAAE
jgi:hypothetical protein